CTPFALATRGSCTSSEASGRALAKVPMGGIVSTPHRPDCSKAKEEIANESQTVRLRRVSHSGTGHGHRPVDCEPGRPAQQAQGAGIAVRSKLAETTAAARWAIRNSSGDQHG